MPFWEIETAATPTEWSGKRQPSSAASAVLMVLLDVERSLKMVLDGRLTLLQHKHGIEYVSGYRPDEHDVDLFLD